VDLSLDNDETQALVTHILILFLDGFGLGSDNPDINPIAAAKMPTVHRLLGGHPLVESTSPFSDDFVNLYAIDAQLGVPGLPQSASGQAALLTGRNVPEEIGEHYGPKPNRAIAEILHDDNLFIQVQSRGGSSALHNAYPPRYFENIRSGRRLYSAIPMAFDAAGVRLMDAEDLKAGNALSADFTGSGWNSQAGFPIAPQYSPLDAGLLLASLSKLYTVSMFDYWLSDFAGHRSSLPEAAELLEALDAVLEGLFRAWDKEHDLLVITSDHGNIEDSREGKHTYNQVPALLYGPEQLRAPFVELFRDLTGLYPAILHVLYGA
jgi:2,3-bisphosphoglycerate-independent phosphoglycerate mutase